MSSLEVGITLPIETPDTLTGLRTRKTPVPSSLERVGSLHPGRNPYSLHIRNRDPSQRTYPLGVRHVGPTRPSHAPGASGPTPVPVSDRPRSQGRLPGVGCRYLPDEKSGPLGVSQGEGDSLQT